MDDFAKKILVILRASEKPMLAREIVVALHDAGAPTIDRRGVNQRLYGSQLANHVIRDSEFKWSLRTASRAIHPGNTPFQEALSTGTNPWNLSAQAMEQLKSLGWTFDALKRMSPDQLFLIRNHSLLFSEFRDWSFGKLPEDRTVELFAHFKHRQLSKFEASARTTPEPIDCDDMASSDIESNISKAGYLEKLTGQSLLFGRTLDDWQTNGASKTHSRRRRRTNK